MRLTTLDLCRKAESLLPMRADRRDAIAALRALGPALFTESLWYLPHPELPRLSSLLPRMAAPEIQRNFTGNCGSALLAQTLPFIELLRSHFRAIRGAEIAGRRILDFGCGYGRFARALYFFTDEDRLVGVDPSADAISLCHSAGMLQSQFRLSEPLPESLPVDEEFDLIIAYSVFTHLSARAFRTCMMTLRKYVGPGGVLAFTIRPPEYWSVDPSCSTEMANRLRQEHECSGYAFTPHRRAPIDGEITYGDCSMTLEWLARNAPRWRIVATSHATGDPMQRCVVLQAA
jgi:SAM-dependent methyltransferase